jgi:hypothetical protein
LVRTISRFNTTHVDSSPGQTLEDTLKVFKISQQVCNAGEMIIKVFGTKFNVKKSKNKIPQSLGTTTAIGSKMPELLSTSFEAPVSKQNDRP